MTLDQAGPTRNMTQTQSKKQKQIRSNSQDTNPASLALDQVLSIPITKHKLI